MWCTTECWNCEDKTCEHYISKQDIYFKYKTLLSNWNSLREWLEDENNQQYSKFIPNYSINNWVLDKMNELESKIKRQEEEIKKLKGEADEKSSYIKR